MKIDGTKFVRLSGAALLVCQTAVTGAGPAPSHVPEIPQLTCAAHGNPDGVAAKLTADRTQSGDPAYIEFRQRLHFTPNDLAPLT